MAKVQSIPTCSLSGLREAERLELNVTAAAEICSDMLLVLLTFPGNSDLFFEIVEQTNVLKGIDQFNPQVIANSSAISDRESTWSNVLQRLTRSSIPEKDRLIERLSHATEMEFGQEIFRLYLTNEFPGNYRDAIYRVVANHSDKLNELESEQMRNIALFISSLANLRYAPASSNSTEIPLSAEEALAIREVTAILEKSLASDSLAVYQYLMNAQTLEELDLDVQKIKSWLQENASALAANQPEKFAEAFLHLEDLVEQHEERTTKH